MHILVYIEPMIESGAPLAKSYWVHNWLPRIVTSVKIAYGDKAKVTLLGGSTFLGDARIPDVEVVSIDPLEVLDLWEFNPDQILLEAFRWDRSPSAIMLSDRIKRHLPKTSFDIVIVFGAQGYHRNLFPNTPVLYNEFSFFKSPGPDTWYFDQVGPGGSAWFERFWTSFQLRWQPSPEQLSLAQRYRDTYRSTVLSRGSLGSAVQAFTERFEQTVLLPLQMDGAATFSAFSPMQSQFNLATGVRRRLPDTVGLVITEHPRQVGGLTDDGREYLRRLDNVLIVSRGGALGPSDEVAPFVDGIATVTSTVGALALLWGKSLISITGKYLAPFADHLGPPPWPLTSRCELSDLSLLAFFMAHWAVPAAQIEDPNWIRSLFTQAINVNTGHADPGLPIPAWQTTLQDVENAWFSRMRD